MLGVTRDQLSRSLPKEENDGIICSLFCLGSARIGSLALFRGGERPGGGRRRCGTLSVAAGDVLCARLLSCRGLACSLEPRTSSEHSCLPRCPEGRQENAGCPAFLVTTHNHHGRAAFIKLPCVPSMCFTVHSPHSRSAQWVTLSPLYRWRTSDPQKQRKLCTGHPRPHQPAWAVSS